MDVISLFNIIDPCWIFLGIFLMSVVGYICWRNPYEYNTFTECVASIGGNEGTIMIPNEQAITADLIIPANITLRFIQGGYLNVSAGVTVTINGTIEAGLYQIFKGSGLVVFSGTRIGNGLLKNMYPHWEGGHPLEAIDVRGGIKVRDRTPQAVVTFTIDDNNALTDWDDLFATKGIPGVAFNSTDSMAGNTAPWLNLQAEGWEIGSHSKSHPHLAGLTEAQIEDEVGGSKALLDRWGFTVRNFCYPFGGHNALVRKIVRKYYLGATDTISLVNVRPFKMEVLSRISGDGVGDLNALKAIVDDTVSLGGWMIVTLHASDAPKLTKIGDLIDYIQGLNVEILTMSEAEDLIGNLVESQRFRVGAMGEIEGKSPIVQNLLDNSQFGLLSLTDTNKGLCTLAYDNGNKNAGTAPSVGDACVGTTSGTGIVISYTITNGAWADGDAAGVLTLGACTGSWIDNDGLTFDGVETAQVNGESVAICNDPCNNDGTGDWTDPDAILSDNVGEYLVTTDANNEKAYLTGLTFTKGKIYKVEAALKDGTATPTDIELVSLDGAVVEKASAPINTTAAFVTYSLTFEATAGTDGVGIRTPTSLGGNNIQMKWFICYEITPCCTTANSNSFDKWNKYGGGATYPHVYREHSNEEATTKKGSFYALKIVPRIAASRIDFPDSSIQTQEEWCNRFRGKTVTIGMWILTNTADHAMLRIYDGSPYYSDYHAGGGEWEWIEKTHTIDLSATQLLFSIILSVGPNVDGSTIVYASQPMLIFGNSIGEGNYIPKQREFIWLSKSINSNFLYNRGGLGDIGITSLNIEADSDAILPKGCKKISLYSAVRDSASAGTDCYLQLRRTAADPPQYENSPYGLVNNMYKKLMGEQPCDNNGDVSYKIEASDGATFRIQYFRYLGVQVS